MVQKLDRGGYIDGRVLRQNVGRGPQKVRWVPPFSYQSLQKNTKVIPPPRRNPFKPTPLKTTLFRKFFLRGDIPANTKPVAPGEKNVKRKKKSPEKTISLVWDVPPQSLDYSYYLPIFFDGLADMEEPYKTVASQGVNVLISIGGEKESFREALTNTSMLQINRKRIH